MLRNVQFSWESWGAVISSFPVSPGGSPGGDFQCKALESFENFILKPPNSAQIFQENIYLIKATKALLISWGKPEIFDNIQIFPETQKNSSEAATWSVL